MQLLELHVISHVDVKFILPTSVFYIVVTQNECNKCIQEN